jgi:hypothetical protein
MQVDWEAMLDVWLPAGARRAGATGEELERTEERLGVRLPPSYKAFLTATNGCMTGGRFIYELWDVGSIEWFDKLNRQWVEAYAGTEPLAEPTVTDSKYFIYGAGQDAAYLRVEYLSSALQISPEGDSAVYLLNPRVVTDGEWEAWFFANWLPGATRYRSFAEMMVDEYASK